MTKQSLIDQGFTHLWVYFFGGEKCRRPLRVGDYPMNQNVGGSSMMFHIEAEARENGYTTESVVNLNEAWWME